MAEKKVDPSGAATDAQSQPEAPVQVAQEEHDNFSHLTVHVKGSSSRAKVIHGFGGTRTAGDSE